MKYTPTPLRSILAITLFITGLSSYAINSKAIEQQADGSIKELYHTLNTMPNKSMAERIDWFSSQFKDVPYILGSLGEGPNARYDQYPLYRIDGFDCDTYVNTVLALALANSLDTFKQCLEYSRYKDGKISYINRNHFTSIDWNANNQQRGMLKDITLTIKNKQNKSVALYAEALIDKPGWYAHKKVNTIRLQKENKQEQEQRLAELKNKGSQLKATVSKIPYIPFTVLFPMNDAPNLYLFSQIPTGAIIEIVRPGWDLRKVIGTSLNISHLGFAIRINDQLYFRQASSQYGKIVDVPLIDYLKEAIESPTIKGINVQIVLPKKPVRHNCRTPNLD
ncbi:N-acetylmuramoyl-L-alanine amidase-like domain-containing protein [uncultured Legionella sp.]|uniref:N-acetylmuramoyl-L-alanine amidase-like domain-containing protein n=1 Tax=uncultured Legionella sp. TaxID=210934 RepID=UPI002618C698|nr:N-acetylmuramoyl-L-alanine amidase-like domain-containing protein [uncultured Legionella sp.]